MKLYNYPMLLLIVVFFLLGAFFQGWENLYGFSSGSDNSASCRATHRYAESDPDMIYSPWYTGEDYLLINPTPMGTADKKIFGIFGLNQVELVIISPDGKSIRDLIFNKEQFDGRPIYWDKRDQNGYKVTPGIYYCMLKVNEMTISKRILLVR
ncbi:MAG: hypothetical protein NT175_10170 [Bacteroidetes bacterium]|nr:hypothetical protein [Bacteroidota bacterium]